MNFGVRNDLKANKKYLDYIQNESYFSYISTRNLPVILKKGNFFRHKKSITDQYKRVQSKYLRVTLNTIKTDLHSYLVKLSYLIQLLNIPLLLQQRRGKINFKN